MGSLVEEELVNFAVGVAVEKDGAAGETVATGAADLLVEGFDGGGERGVDDGADVGLVDSHSEGDGGDDDFELSGLEVVLHALADAGVEAGMVGGGGKVVGQIGGEGFRIAARGRVDDGGARGGARGA